MCISPAGRRDSGRGRARASSCSDKLFSFREDGSDPFKLDRWELRVRHGVRVVLGRYPGSLVLGAAGGWVHGGSVAARALLPESRLQGNRCLQWIPPPTSLQITGKWITKFCDLLFEMCSQAPSANSYQFIHICDFHLG